MLRDRRRPWCLENTFTKSLHVRILGFPLEILATTSQTRLTWTITSLADFLTSFPVHRMLPLTQFPHPPLHRNPPLRPQQEDNRSPRRQTQPTNTIYGRGKRGQEEPDSVRDVCVWNCGIGHQLWEVDAVVVRLRVRLSLCRRRRVRGIDRVVDGFIEAALQMKKLDVLHLTVWPSSEHTVEDGLRANPVRARCWCRMGDSVLFCSVSSLVAHWDSQKQHSSTD